MRIFKWFCRLFLWIFSFFGLFQKRLDFAGGWDTLHPWALYSFGGLSRKDFLILWRREKRGELIKIQQVHLCTYGQVPPNISRKVFLEIADRCRFTYQYFSSPWKRNYNFR